MLGGIGASENPSHSPSPVISGGARAEDRQRDRIVVQAKHTTVAGKVGSAVMYQVKGTPARPTAPISRSW
jgi:hypothetical protein